MGTDLEKRKDSTFKVVMENGLPATRQIVGWNAVAITGDDKDAARYLLQLDTPITIENTNHTYTACFYASREEEMFKDVTFPVMVELGLDGKKLRPNAIITPVVQLAADQTPDADDITGAENTLALETAAVVYGIGDKIQYMGEKPIDFDEGQMSVNKGDYGWIQTVEEDDSMSVHFEFMPVDENTVSVNPAEIRLIEKAQPVASEGTDKDAPGVDVAAYDNRIQELAALNADLINMLHKAESRVADLERAQEIEEVKATLDPLPTAIQWEIVPLWDMKPEHFNRAEAEKWEFLEIALDSDAQKVHALVRRPVQPNGTPKPTMTAVAEVVYSAPVTAMQETPVAVMAMDAEQETVAKQDAYQQGCKWGAVDRESLGRGFSGMRRAK